MLLRFTTRNHLSLRETQTLSMVASSLSGPTEGLRQVPSTNFQVVPTAVIYGANASGKSNLVHAIQFMRGSVLNSQTRSNPSEKVLDAPFMLDPAALTESSFYEVEFIVHDDRYIYGFEVYRGRFSAEWLYRYNRARRIMMYERTNDAFRFGRAFLAGSREIRLISKLVRPNSLFISAAVQNNVASLQKVYDFFQRGIHDGRLDSDDIAVIFLTKNSTIERKVINFLSGLGTGVVGYRRRDIQLKEDQKSFVKRLVDLIGENLPEHISERLSSMQIDNRTEVELAHISADGSDVFFPLNLESTGTRRLLNLMSVVFQVLDDGGVLIVDEVDSSLHTQACEAIFALFASKRHNKGGGQLICTTHDTNLLRSSLLRRDQVWFMEKDSVGATTLFPLSDIKIRSTDNIRKAYVEGRLGAVPLSSPVSDFVESL